MPTSLPDTTNKRRPVPSAGVTRRTFIRLFLPFVSHGADVVLWTRSFLITTRLALG